MQIACIESQDAAAPAAAKQALVLLISHLCRLEKSHESLKQEATAFQNLIKILMVTFAGKKLHSMFYITAGSAFSVLPLQAEITGCMQVYYPNNDSVIFCMCRRKQTMLCPMEIKER